MKNKDGFIREITHNAGLYFMMLPGLLMMLVFNYIPMLGITIPFRDSKTVSGYFSGDWIGFKNFEFFFKSQDAARITSNTITMNIIFIIVGTVVAVLLGLLLNELGRRSVKTYQTVMLFPYMLSWVIMGFITYAFLNVDYGLINKILNVFGVERINWYSEPKYWPVILTVVRIIKNAGYDSVMYYARILSIDTSLYEAAAIDGAGKLKQVMKITIPLIRPLIVTLVLLSIGRIFYADFGMFYYIPRESGMLFPKTDVIDTYVYRALRVLGNTGMSAAVGLFQSVVGFILVLISNAVVRKIEPENALF